MTTILFIHTSFIQKERLNFTSPPGDLTIEYQSVPKSPFRICILIATSYIVHQINMVEAVATDPSNPVVFFDVALAGMNS